MQISSLDNPLVKEASHLRDRHWRNKLNLFAIEGYRETLRAVENQWKINHLFVCPELFLGSNEPELIEAAKKNGAKIIPCTEKVFRKLSYRDRPDGLLAVAPQKELSLKSFPVKKNGLYIVAESIEKPGNLGTILRSSDAAGADGLIICNRCTDIYNPNVVRASCGTLFSVPIAECSTDEALNWLKAHSVMILAAMPQAEAIYTNVDMTQAVAIAVGTEQLGLSDSWKTQAMMQVRIPMLGKADSLNVAMATTLILYEAVRQRH